jgi:AraC-like DNA-binding protein
VQFRYFQPFPLHIHRSATAVSISPGVELEDAISPLIAMSKKRCSLDLQPLLRNCLFRSDDRVDCHDQIVRELTDHSLKWHRGVIDTSMFRLRLQRLRMYLLRYGPEVEINARPFDDFMLVHTSLRGAAEIECDGRKMQTAQGQSIVFSPTRRLHLRWLSGTEALILKIPNTLVRDIQAPSGSDALPGRPGFLLATALEPHWASLVQCLLNIEASYEVSNLNPEWLVHFEQNVVRFLLKHQPTNVTFAGGPKPAFDAGAAENVTYREGVRRIDKVYEYMHSQLNSPISLLDLADAGGVSTRTLNLLCHRHFGLTPMILLRNLRLDAIHSRLLLQPDANITSMALDFGFGSPGRFAAYYRQRFSELPHETQRHHRKDEEEEPPS